MSDLIVDLQNAATGVIRNTVNSASSLLSLSSSLPNSINGASNRLSSAIPNITTPSIPSMAALDSVSNINTTLPNTSGLLPSVSAITGLPTTGNIPNINAALSMDVASLPNTLAMPTFTTGASDSLSAVDVYGVTSNSPINSIQATPAIPTLAAAEALRGSNNSLTDLNSIISNAARNTATLNTVNPINRINGPLANATRALPVGCATGLMQEIANILSRLTGGRLSVGGLLSKLLNSNLACIVGMGGLINSVSGVANSISINDPSASIASLSGVVNASSRLGIPNVYGTLVPSMNGQQDIINSVAVNSLSTVIGTSDLGSFSSMSRYASPGTLLMANPNVINDFSSSYRIPDGATASDSSSRYNDLMGSFNTVDPNWNYTVRQTDSGSVTITDLSCIVGASPDFNQTVSNGVTLNGDTANQTLLLAPAFPVTTVNDEVAASYPNTINTAPAADTVDPVTLNNQINNDVAAIQASSEYNRAAENALMAHNLATESSTTTVWTNNSDGTRTGVTTRTTRYLYPDSPNYNNGEPISVTTNARTFDVNGNVIS